MRNDWNTLSEQRNGVTVQRKFAGMHTEIDIENNVKFCIIYYYERELYPNGTPIKTERKSYTLNNLSEFISTDDNGTYKLDATDTLDYWITNLGQAGIIDPVNGTIINLELLPLDIEDNYPLKRDTRTKTYIEPDTI